MLFKGCHILKSTIGNYNKIKHMYITKYRVDYNIDY